jgi:hypothetical protein
MDGGRAAFRRGQGQDIGRQRQAPVEDVALRWPVVGPATIAFSRRKLLEVPRVGAGP